MPILFFMSKGAIMSQRITLLTIEVPYKSAGGIIMQKPVEFELYREEEYYTLVPQLTEDERRVANLPEELKFVMSNGKPVSLRGKLDGNFHVIQDAVTQLQGQHELI